jgi:mono/diheme cytochrome c family protein
MPFSVSLRTQRIQLRAYSFIACFAVAMAIVQAPSLFASDEDANVVDFNRDVRPILAGHCLQCHGPDAGTRKADLRFDTPVNAYTDRGEYRVIDPRKPEQSELLTRITSDDPDVQMPPPDSPRKLSTEQIAVLRRWIEQGAVWSEHWAFVPPLRPSLPAVADPSWPRNGVDFFVLERLENEGLEPAAPADRITLLRRVTLTLTGVPPTIQEVDAFLADNSPGAYEKAVTRLLESPRYGEHMALAWLDAARYADTSGYQADWERFMWPWRDWVVQAYNANMPFDQFTIEQLAGDLIPGSTMSQKLATGFNRNHRINDEGGSLDAEFEVEYVVDRVDTTSTVWLGLTAGCARCHDHKYDPVSQKEFYRLYAFFNNVPEKGIDGRKGAAVPFIEIPNHSVQARLEQVKHQLQLLQDRQTESGGDSSRDASLNKEITALEEAIKELEPRAMTQVMVMQELQERRATYLLKRGAYDQPDTREQMSPALPHVFGALPAGAPSDRLALARWLMSPENPLTGRVTANRLWQHHFGTGLVSTSEDFGSRGERPSHPELLDWLATELVRSKWDIKAIHRLIVTSSAFRQSSHVSTNLLERDPHNRLLARGPRRRLTGAAIRDQALFVSGLLSQSMRGPPLKPYQPEGLWKELSFASGKTTVDFYVQDHGEGLYRRSLYTFWKRTVAPPRMSVFDGTGREMCRVRMELTNTPMQALTLQNDVTFVEAARHLARRMLTEGGGTTTDRITYGWRLALCRPPHKDELATLRRSLDRYLQIYRADDGAALRLVSNGESERDARLDVARYAAFTMIAQTILNLDETIMRE